MLLLQYSFVLSLVLLKKIIHAEQNVSTTTESLGSEVTIAQSDEPLQDIKLNIMKVSRPPKRATAESWFVDSKIVPEIIPVAPKVLALVTFSSNVRVFHGNYLSPSMVKNMPNIAWNASWDNYYTLLAIEADFPSHKKPMFRVFLQWSVVNIPGYDISNGTTVAEYSGAGPPAKSGLHRFIFLVYQQPNIIDFDEETKSSSNSTSSRNEFSTIEFANKYKLGNPIAGNFFQTSHDEYELSLYNKLGISQATTSEPEIVIVPALMLVYVWNKYVL